MEKVIWYDVFNGERSNKYKRLESHTHNYYELSCVFVGKLSVLFQKRKYRFSNNCIILSPPNTPHHIMVEEGRYFRYNIYFYKSAMDKLLGYSVKLDNLFINGGGAISLTSTEGERIKDIIELLVNNSNEESLKLLLAILLNEISNINKSTQPNGCKSYIDDVERLILSEYGSKLIAAELADKFFVSRTKLMTDFKKKTGKTLSEYITFVRLEMAKEYLLSGASIVTTAVTCGFVNSANFTRIFKKYFNMCPKDYKKKFSF